MPELKEYGNFWLIWITCAGEKKSLFGIQKEWGITTNYLYHSERALGEPTFRSMIKEGYLEKEGKYLIAKFDWIKKFILLNYPGSLLEKFVDKFFEVVVRYKSLFFDLKKLKLLFRGNPTLVKKYGRNIFLYIFLFLLYQDFLQVSKLYKAEYVAKIFKNLLEFIGEINLKAYFEELEREWTEGALFIKTLDEWIKLSKM